MQAQIENTIQRSILLIKRNQHMEALDRLIEIVNPKKNNIASILIPIYKYLKHTPEDNQCKILISHLYILCNRFNDAFLELEEIIENDIYFTQTYFLLNKLYSKGIKQKEIVVMFEKAFKKGVNDTSITDLLPNIYLKENNIEKSISLFKSLTKENSNISHLKTLASLYIQSRNNKDAVITIKKIIEQAPEYALEAAQDCEKMIRTDPMNISLKKTCINFYIQSCNPCAIIKHLDDILRIDPTFTSKAIKIIDDGLEKFPNTPQLLLLKAKNLVSLNEFSLAIECLKNIQKKSNASNKLIEKIILDILEKYPNQIMGLELLIRLYYSEEKYEESLKTLEKLVLIQSNLDTFILDMIEKLKSKLPRHQKELILMSARIYKEKKAYSDALNLLTSLHYTHLHKEAKIVESEILIAEKKFEESIHLLIELHIKFPENKEVYSTLKTTNITYVDYQLDSLDKKNHYKAGHLYLQKRAFYEALEQFQKITSKNIDYLNAQALIGYCFLALGKYEICINLLSRTVSYLGKENNEFSNNCRFMICSAYLHLGKTKEALKELETIVETDIQFPKAQQILDKYTQKSLLDLRGKAISGVSKHGSEQLQLISIPNPEESSVSSENQKISFAHPHNNHGVDYLLKENIPSADAELNLATQMDRDLTIAHCNLSILKLIQGKDKEAIKCLEEAKEINAHLPIININKALLNKKEKNFDLAIKEFKEALSHTPNCGVTLINLGDCHFEKGELKTAYEYWKKASDLGIFFHFIQERIWPTMRRPFKDLEWIKNTPFLNEYSK
jgi:tetratricopeptide (TPR) repeat protein